MIHDLQERAEELDGRLCEAIAGMEPHYAKVELLSKIKRHLCVDCILLGIELSSSINYVHEALENAQRDLEIYRVAVDALTYEAFKARQAWRRSFKH